MRTLLAAILAGVSAPALSEPLERGDPSVEARAERGARPAHRAGRAERKEAVAPRRQGSFERPGDSGIAGSPRAVERPVPAGRLARASGQAEPQFTAPAEPARRRAAGDSVREWRMGERRRADSPSSIEERNLREAPRLSGGGGLVAPTRPLPRVFDPDRRRVSRTPVFGAEPPLPATAGTRHAEPATRWSTQWRRDHRYDWRDWRRRHRSRFHLGFYYDPFGWGYHRYSVGWRLWPQYYRSSYWLSDPWHYRLPPAYGPYRWIRYHDDALLVNLYTGEVVDVIYDFFW